MQNGVSRRQFLRGDFRRKVEYIRPPWALPEKDFIKACTRCNECINKCPEKILVKGESGLPTINFDLGACTFCKECVSACSDNALSIDNKDQLPWKLMANISGKCISLQGVSCRSCADSCAVEAISFHHQVGGISKPDIDTKTCTACGACVAPCPVKAIKISENNSM